MRHVDLIYSSAGNARFASLALQYGWHAGARLPSTVYAAPFFSDQDWRAPVKDVYMSQLAIHRPTLATVLDWERYDQMEDVFEWAEEAAAFAETIIIIPKVFHTVPMIPHSIGGKPVRLGYSVPTEHGGTPLPLWDFRGREIHLLGGSPQEQLRLSRHLNVVSADTNYHQKMAVKYAAFWVNGTARGTKNRYFPSLSTVGNHTRDDAPYIAFEMSCLNIIEAWRKQGYAVNEQLSACAGNLEALR